MISTAQLVELVRSKNDNCTNYRIGKLLGASHQTVANWENEISTMNDKYALKAAQLAGLDEKYVLASLHAEAAKNSKNSESFTVWCAMADMLEPANMPIFGQQQQLAV